jgi:hypothetical protein
MQAYLLELDLALNTEAVKYTILIVSLPLWWPFFRELWREFNDILAEEGGLLGRKPSESELAEIRRRRADKAAALVRQLREEARAGPSRKRSGPRSQTGYTSTRRGASGAQRGAGLARSAGTSRGRGGFGPPR